MFNLDHLNRVLALVQKTGDKMVLLPEGQEPIVLMSLKQYEGLSAPAKQVLAGGVMFRVTSEDIDHLKGLSEDQMLEKVNREIGIWKENQPADATANSQLPTANNQLSELGSQELGVAEAEAASAEEKFYIEPVEQL